jgi:hypothetical protein
VQSSRSQPQWPPSSTGELGSRQAEKEGRIRLGPRGKPKRRVTLL